MTHSPAHAHGFDRREVWLGFKRLAPLALHGDNGARLALADHGRALLVLKRPLPAIAAGVLAAATFRHWFPVVA